MTIEEIKQLVNQRIIENYTGDITAEDVNRILNEILDNMGDQETKVTQLTSKVGDIDIVNSTLTYRGKTYLLVRIEGEEPVYTGAICGRAICGQAICGTI